MKDKLIELVEQIKNKLSSYDIRFTVKENVELYDGSGPTIYPYVLNLEFSMDELVGVGIDVFSLALSDDDYVFWDWFSPSTIVIGDANS